MLLVADVVEGGIPRLRPVADVLEMPRLGQDLDRTRRLHPDAIARTLAAIARQVERARALKVDRLIVVGTESLRAAENSDEFLTALLATGIELRVISGDEEARLSWRSVAESLPLPASGRRSVLDIGGGSTELVVGGGGERPERWASVKIGSVRLHERCIRHDPPTREEVAALLAAIDAGLDKLPAPEGELVALAGTATTVLLDAAHNPAGCDALVAFLAELGDDPAAHRRASRHDRGGDKRSRRALGRPRGASRRKK